MFFLCIDCELLNYILFVVIPHKLLVSKMHIVRPKFSYDPRRLKVYKSSTAHVI